VRESGWVVVAIIITGVALTSCQPHRSVPPSVAAPARPAASLPAGKVEVHAYINVSSGCQADTVALLEKLVADNAQYVDYQITDFGSSEGAKEWMAAGLDCMAILFNDSPAVVLEGRGGQSQLVIFERPAGQGPWTHEDLRATFAAIRKGTFRSATQAEIDQYRQPVKVDVQVIAQQVQDLDKPGKQYGQVVMDGQVVMVFKQAAGRRSPVQRAQAAAGALREWLSEPVLPSDLDLEELDDGFGLLVAGIEVAQATKKDAEEPGIVTKKLCATWAKAINSTVMMAMARARRAKLQTQVPAEE